MGHIRLKRLPATRKWRDVVGLLLVGAPVEQVAFASSDAAEAALRAPGAILGSPTASGC